MSNARGVSSSAYALATRRGVSARCSAAGSWPSARSKSVTARSAASRSMDCSRTARRCGEGALDCASRSSASASSVMVLLVSAGAGGGRPALRVGYATPAGAGNGSATRGQAIGKRLRQASQRQGGEQQTEVTQRDVVVVGDQQ